MMESIAPARRPVPASLWLMLVSLLCLSVTAQLWLHALPATMSTTPMFPDRGMLPLSFVPNHGQFAAPVQAEARRQQQESGAEKVRHIDEGEYQAESWFRARRVVLKAELLPKGPNLRFVVTNRSEAAPAVYDAYVERGEAENWIKDLKNACRADRLSCHRFVANQFRLLLHGAAYWLLDTLRRWLTRAGAQRMQLDSLRLVLLKIGGRVLEVLDQVRLRLASSHPGQILWNLLASRHLMNNPG